LLAYLLSSGESKKGEAVSAKRGRLYDDQMV